MRCHWFWHTKQASKRQKRRGENTKYNATPHKPAGYPTSNLSVPPGPRPRIVSHRIASHCTETCATAPTPRRRSCEGPQKRDDKRGRCYGTTPHHPPLRESAIIVAYARRHFFLQATSDRERRLKERPSAASWPIAILAHSFICICAIREIAADLLHLSQSKKGWSGGAFSIRPGGNLLRVGYACESSLDAEAVGAGCDLLVGSNLIGEVVVDIY